MSERDQDQSEEAANERTAADAPMLQTLTLTERRTVDDQQQSRVVRAKPKGRGRKYRMRKWVDSLAFIGVICALLVGAVRILGFHPSMLDQKAAPVSQSFVAMAPQARNLTCEQDAAWSPDGRQVALLGYKNTCAEALPARYRYVPGIVSIYDVTTGRLIRQLSLDTHIQQALHLTSPTGVTPASPGSATALVIQYYRVLWSRDGSLLVFPFAVDPAPASPTSATIAGLLLTDANGGNARVLSHTLKPGEKYSGEWDLTAGAYVPASSTFTPALAYQWGANGSLTPLMPLSASTIPAAAPLGSVGNPIGDRAVSAWQPSIATLKTTVGPADNPTPVPRLYNIQTSFALWSPDGRYLETSVDLASWLSLDGGNSARKQTLSRQNPLPLLPVRDQALRAALTSASATLYNPDQAAIQLAWSPDGRALAVQYGKVDLGGGVSKAGRSVVVYDCATGNILAKLTPGQIAAAPEDTMRLLSWSPDGTRLLLFDERLGVLSVWGPGSLPKV